MQLDVFAAAAIWMTLLLAVLVLFVTREKSSAVRILAIDTMTLVLISILVLHSVSTQQPYYLDAALALALFSFIGTVAIARRLGSGSVL